MVIYSSCKTPKAKYRLAIESDYISSTNKILYQTLASKVNLEEGMFSGPPCTSKCLQPAFARTYLKWSPCKPWTKWVAYTPLR